ncbi:MAG TPA: transketolase [Candidatus Paenalcaligenes intestinipullorum]|uniref:Transketolase n=1 Tax=Candidatus Paenalcaligenes intestinipullorum TaxID=2838718 RepID=A0A9D2RL84_9BURK|nr:transketolase [Candidatus Paenalcaligenes intestinipullorum]
MDLPSSTVSPMANAIRALAMDAVQQAKSGHPGAPMGMAEIAEVLWTRHLKHNPADPSWFDRDRFVLSNGHGSMLIYALLHLSGYDLPMSELKNFRQLHSRTPGHPEVGDTIGVETTTGPLGQGISNAVGMALAEALLAQEFNRPEHTIVDHYTYAFVGDGCLMEGISHEACSFAGTLKLSKLIVFYDDNGISIDGKVESWFGDNTPERFRSYGWQVIENVDGHDTEALNAAILQAKQNAGNHTGPTLICCKTVIGKGSPNLAGSEKTHGAPLGDDEIAATRKAIGWNHAPFVIPEDVYEHWDGRKVGGQAQAQWEQNFAQYKQSHPKLAAEFVRRMKGELPADFAQQAQAFIQATADKQQTVASRKASQLAIEALVTILPEMLGGSADLTGSNLTNWPGVQPVRAGEKAIEFGRHINYGVREFGMAAIMNGLSLHGGYLPFGGTFLTFSDYSRNAIRMAALMRQRVVHVFTHDSIGLGEDGPTHQSIEHASSLRLIPNLDVWRPCDTTETAVAWVASVSRPQSVGVKVQSGGPSALLLSRQNLPFVERDEATVQAIARGGYVLSDADNAQAIIIATGSEVGLALDAQAQLADKGVAVRVVSMPCTRIFDQQDEAWKESVLPAQLPRVAVEAGSTALWYKYVGSNGAVVGIDTYGASAPADALFEHFGITAKAVVQAVEQLL